MEDLTGDNMKAFFKFIFAAVVKKLDVILALIPINGGKLYIGLAITGLATIQVLVGGFDPTLSALIGDLLIQLKKLQDLTVLDAGVALAIIGAVHKLIKAIKAYIK